MKGCQSCWRYAMWYTHYWQGRRNGRAATTVEVYRERHGDHIRLGDRWRGSETFQPRPVHYYRWK